MCDICRQSQVVGATGHGHPSHGVAGHGSHGGHGHVSHVSHVAHHLSPVGTGVVAGGAAGGGAGSGPAGQGATVVGPGGRSPTSAGPMIAGAQHLGQPLYQEYAHAVRPRAHPVPPPVYVTAAPSQAPAAMQQQQLPTYQGFTPGWVPRHLVDACTCVPLLLFLSCSHLISSHIIFI